jgi:hypothetical protein
MLSLIDLLVIGGFAALITGLWITFGVGPTLIAAGAAVVWLGVALYRATPDGDRG